MYVCMHVCMHVCVRACMYVCICVCLCMFVFMHANDINVCMYARIYACPSSFTAVSVQTCMLIGCVPLNVNVDRLCAFKRVC
jgi:hypothetical protein